MEDNMIQPVQDDAAGGDAPADDSVFEQTADYAIEPTAIPVTSADDDGDEAVPAVTETTEEAQDEPAVITPEIAVEETEAPAMNTDTEVPVEPEATAEAVVPVDTSSEEAPSPEPAVDTPVLSEEVVAEALAEANAEADTTEHAQEALTEEIESVAESAPTEQSEQAPSEPVAEETSAKPAVEQAVEPVVAAVEEETAPVAEAAEPMSDPEPAVEEQPIDAPSIEAPAEPQAVEVPVAEPTTEPGQAAVDEVKLEAASVATASAEESQDTSIVSEQKPMESNQVQGSTDKHAPMASIGHKKDHHSHSMIAILISVVVVIGLVGIGFLAYSGDNDDDSGGTPELQSVIDTDEVQNQTNITPVDEQAVDDETAEIDSLLNEIDAIEDLDTDSLSDENLGIQ